MSEILLLLDDCVHYSSQGTDHKRLDVADTAVIMSATSGYDENELLWDILGPPDYDNFDEPTPWSNKTPTLMALTIIFMVRLCPGLLI